MNLIMTSSLGGASGVNGIRVPSVLIEANGLLDKIRTLWPDNARVLMICSAPDDYMKNDSVIACFEQSFPMSGLPYKTLEICDDRNESVADDISRKDVIILIGGHVPTQNLFFAKIGLKEKLKDYNGLLIAWSAGSMNCADIVYAGPEFPGEAIDPEYQRWLPGLGLTDINIFPHFQSLRDEMLDGMRLIEDITFPDSMRHELIALNDGSYIVSDESGETIYGEAYSIKDGVIKQICSDGGSVKL